MPELIGGDGLPPGEEPPKIEFPCEYPVKILGRKVDEFRTTVTTVLERHAPGFDEASIVIRDSSKGTFNSLSVIITATGPEQLDALHKDLMATGIVNMVL